MSSLKVYLLNLNLFKASDGIEEDDHQHRSNILATRVYLVLLILALIGFTLSLSLSLQTTQFISSHPTLTQFETFPGTAQCPCSDISIPYSQFIAIQATFHQVCSSDFVSDRWIETIFFGTNSTYFYAQDFRTMGSALFRSLASFCLLSKTTVRDNLLSFNTSSFISPQVISKAALQSEVNANIEQMKLTMANIFVSRLQLVRDMTFGNRLLSALQTNVHLSYILAGVGWSIYARFYYNDSERKCNCYTNLDCSAPSGIFNLPLFSTDMNLVSNNETQLMEIPGLLASCLPVNSLLQSTLECFYDPLCVNELLLFISTNKTFTAMSTIEHSRYKVDSTIQSILDFIMVEQWMANISYENYYIHCAPISCAYSMMERRQFVAIVAKIIGLLAGLTSVLSICVPIVVRWIRKKKTHNPSPRVSLFVRFGQLKQLVKRAVIELNLFEHESDDDQHVFYQRIATRLYLTFLIVSLVILTIYFSLIREVYRKTVLNPSESQYIELEAMHLDSFVCPCTSFSVLHETIITLEPVYHQICSSDFVSSSWLDYLGEKEHQYFLWNPIYRVSTLSPFQLLATLCQSARHMIDNSLKVFLKTQFISSKVVSQQIFNSQLNSTIEDWKLSTTNEFIHTIHLIQATNQGNQLMNDLFNFNLQRNATSGQVYSVPLNYASCSCALSDGCHTPMLKIELFLGVFLNVKGTITNFYTGCSPMEALRRSTLECFYSQTCVDMVATFSEFGSYMNVSTLDDSRNVLNETIESIVNRLMLDQWQSSISFASYYNACAPSWCTFEYTNRRTLLILITSIIGIYGGLSIGLKILASTGLRLAEKFIRNCSCRTVTQLIRNLFICQNEKQIAIRLHTFLITSFLLTLYLTTFFTQFSKTTVIHKPSLVTYQHLFSQFPNFLQCPCSQIKSQYHSFLYIKPQLHTVCSSVFITDLWIAYVRDRDKRNDHTDFRATSTNQFQILGAFCQLSQQTLNDALSQLNNSDYIDVQLSTPDMLNEQIRMTIRKSQLAAASALSSTLDLIRRTTEANMLISALFTNWKFADVRGLVIMGRLHTAPIFYQECNCGLSSQCTQPSRGMMVGCYPLEALLQSTLECFYHQECIDPNGNFIALNSSLSASNRFALNATVESILSELMVENYSINTSYEHYFSQCAPSSCSYSHIQRRTSLDILTSLISLYGGLTIIIHWIVTAILQVRRRRIRRIAPQTIVLNR